MINDEISNKLIDEIYRDIFDVIIVQMKLQRNEGINFLDFSHALLSSTFKICATSLFYVSCLLNISKEGILNLLLPECIKGLEETIKQITEDEINEVYNAIEGKINNV